MKKLYLAGEAYSLKDALQNLKGVICTIPVHAVAQNGEELYGVEIEYNPKKQDICGILEAYFAVVDPFAKDELPLQLSAVFYTSNEDVPQLESRGHEPGAALGNLIVNDSITAHTEIRPLQLRFGRLHEYHYLA